MFLPFGSCDRMNLMQNKFNESLYFDFILCNQYVVKI